MLMPYEMESPGITFTVEWRKKSNAISWQEDITSIGLWDPDDSTLDWQTFKSYVCQNLGTMDNISMAYVDSEGDELPIESECEFREAIKFARQRAQKGRATILKVDREESSDPHVSACKFSEAINQDKAKSLRSSCPKQKHRMGIKSFCKSYTNGKASVQTSPAASEERKMEDKNKPCSENYEASNTEHAELFLSIIGKIEKLQKMNLDQMDTPPQWFRRYMQKLKTEIVTEVTNKVLHEIQQSFTNQKDYNGSGSWPQNKNKKKKKLSDEESSDGALGCESRDHKLLKKIEKLHKREKKLEKKLDSKLEKLENKTKRMMEKRSQCKARCEKLPERKLCPAKRRSGDLHFGTYLMDAVLLNDGPSTEISILPGEHFTKVWEIMNAGTLPWTDKTELRHAWGTSGLEPEETVVKCPILQSGEQGTISMKFKAPEFPGKFKSYWHFYHMGDRFGRWIGCAVVVKGSKEEKPTLPKVDDVSYGTKMRNEHAVDLSLKTTLDSSKLQSHKTECEQKNGTQSSSERVEYESDCESDNLSVISGPVSESSDSEDENFVVIPMPACFVCDVPLGHTDTVPVVVKSDFLESKHVGNNTDTKRDVVESSSHESNDFQAYDSVAMNTNAQQPQFEDKPLEKVYAVDSSGCCIAVETSYESSVPHEEEEEDDENEDEDKEEQEAVIAATAATTTVTATVTATATTATATAAAAAAAASQTSRTFECGHNERFCPCTPKNTNSNKKRDISPPVVHSETFHFGTEQSAGDGSHQNTNGNIASASNTTNHLASSSLGHDPLTNVIHILPETIVTGAVNVASSAFNRACAVISNLRTRPHGDGAEWQWNGEPASDSTTTKNLEHLFEMGFTNRMLNVLLLQQYDNDLTKVVAELVSFEE